MADFFATQTDNTSVGDSILSVWNQQTLFEAAPELVAVQLATMKVVAGAATIYFPRFAQMANVTSALTDSTETSATEVTDTALSITPVEYGAVVCRTLMSNVQSGGRVDLAVTKLVGQNMGSSIDGLALAPLEAFSTDVIYPNGKTAKTQLDAGDVLDGKFAGRLYNRLARKNIPSIGGAYMCATHEDALYDLKEDAGSGGWTPVSQYSNLTAVLNNEVGMFKGIRWLRTANSTIESNVNGTVDGYYVAVVGENALGYGVSVEPHITITGPFDSLGRFLNIGWYGIFDFSVIDTDNMVLGRVASSIGSNT